MSLINQMLKDLDKRGSGAGETESSASPIRAVPERSGSSRWLVFIVLLLAVLGAAAAWHLWQRPAAPAVTAHSPIQSADVEPVLAIPAANQVQSTSNNKPSGDTVLGKQAPIIVLPATRQDQPGVLVRAKQVQSEPTLSRVLPVLPAPKRVAAYSEAGGQGKEVTSLQQAENAYGEAISLLGAGHKSEAIAVLESVLSMNPGHAAARQTLVGLLLDGKRTDEAARKLEEGLKRDPAQSGMAMILARIQVDKNDAKTALATLQRSLPFAAQKPDYSAFMAALLQREKRHQEAITLYAQALNKRPDNGFWWMGYAISLKADNRPAEARQAFIRAKDSNQLSPELQAFVEQEISRFGGV